MGIQVEDIELVVERSILPDGRGVLELASGHLLNLGCATGHPSFILLCSCSFTNQVRALLGLLETRTGTKAYGNDVRLLPKGLDD